MKAILVGINKPNNLFDANYTLLELENLANTLEIEVADKVIQNLERINPKTYIGKGKLNEILLKVITNNIDVCIFDDELTPSQIRNISDILNIEVLDRTYLILKIFELRSSTKESKLEIKLAKDLYLLPRIQYLREKESRIGGGSSTSTRGSGETQRELDRRHLMAEINHIRKELIEIKKMKLNQIEKRKKNEIPIVALVGYTNAGKSSTMNSILEYTNQNNDKNVLEKNQLFSTLATYNRLINYKKVNFMLVDTIGFVSKLPHTLVNSFYETLQEIKNADLIIHVVDSSSIYLNEQIKVVLEVLYNIDANKIDNFFLLNKWDNTIDENLICKNKFIKYSNKTKENIDLLLDTILEEISPSFIHARLLIPYKESKITNIIEKNSNITVREYNDNGIYYDLEIPKKLYDLVKQYDLDMMVS